MTPYVTRLVACTRGELAWWSSTPKPQPSSPAEQQKLATRGLEAFAPFSRRIAGYWWGALSERLDGENPTAWSAAFVSWCMIMAADGGRFPKASGHWSYLQRAARHFPDAMHEPFVALPPLHDAPRPGDIVVAARYQGGRRYVETFEEPRDGGDFPSHGDIVVAVADGRMEVIGGNREGGKVSSSTHVLDGKGRLIQPNLAGVEPSKRKEHPWIALIRCNL
jgi:hypothetical protein